jgi:hypothetical protein
MARTRDRRIARAVARALFAALVASTALTSAPSACAEPSATERATARRLWSEGRELRKRGDLPGALRALRAADAIMSVPTTALDVGRTEMDLGLLVEASESLRRAAKYHVTADAPEPFVKAQKEAEALLAELAPRIPSLRVVVSVDAAEDLDVRLDGRSIPRAALAQPYAVDPGAHVLTLVGRDAAGAPRSEQRVQVTEGASMTVQLTAPRAPHAPPPATNVAPSAAPESAAAPSDASPPRAPGARVAIVSGLVVAGAGAAVGTAAGIVSFAKTSDARAQCRSGACGPATYGTLDQAGTFATVADVAFVITGAGLATAAVGWLWPRSSDGNAGTRGAVVAPIAGHGVAGIAGSVAW